MSQSLDRREFLKLLAMLPMATYLPPSVPHQAGENPPNIVILIFDAWSAENISLYGYPRQTTPNLERLAEKAIVYHNHYAGGHYTVPGTATLLTGVHPWTHRIIIKAAGNPPFDQQNLFNLFNDYYRQVYTHNPLTEEIFNFMGDGIDEHTIRQRLFLNQSSWLYSMFGQDYDTASVSWVRVMKKFDDGYANSLFLSRLYDLFRSPTNEELGKSFPRGLPVIEEDNYFILEQAIDWIIEQAKANRKPYLSFYHLLPPHTPYNTREQYYQAYKDDGYKPTSKPDHPIFSMGLSNKQLAQERRAYDEFILYVDAEFGRLYDSLTQSGVLNNTWLVLTTDHGEIFERGMNTHKQPAFYDPLVRIPLIIFPPGQNERLDIYNPTSAVDIIPTLLHLTGKPQASWLEGTVLPPFNTGYDPARPVYTMYAVHHRERIPFTSGSVMLRKQNHKLIYHFGSENYYLPLEGGELLELYDLEADPEELTDLVESQPQLTKELYDEMYTTMKENGAA